ncbi:MAG: 4-amino-4-deoxy-L-arabinose transferase-like glycosyltransferase [Saprospiraceae bacterium]
MTLSPEHKLGRYLLLFSIGLFLVLTIPSLFSDGMFLDGLMYASISKNLALGEGAFWHLHYTDTFYNQFNEHPPLVFGIQSLFFRVLGDHLWVERCYSLGTCFAVSYFLFKIWTFLGQRKRTFWLPMMFLALTPLMTWSAANNMLENTMSVFTCAAVYFYLKSTMSSRYYYQILCALMVLFAFLSKGFTGLYVWAFPFVFWCLGANRSCLRGFLDSFFLTLFSVLLLLVVFYMNDDCLNAMMRYYERQVVGSLERVVTVKSRFYILTKILTELLIPVGVMLLVYFWSIKTKTKLASGVNKRIALTFFVFGLCGVLPMIISLKQSGFYIVTTFPFFAIALSVLVVDGVAGFQHTVLLKKLKWVKVFSVVLLSVCVMLFGISLNRVGRDKEKLEMIAAFDDKISNNSTVFIPSTMWSDWGMHAYFSRLKNVSLSTDEPGRGSLCLSKEVLGDDFELTLQSGPYLLYQKK